MSKAKALGTVSITFHPKAVLWSSGQEHLQVLAFGKPCFNEACIVQKHCLEQDWAPQMPCCNLYFHKIIQ